MRSGLVPWLLPLALAACSGKGAESAVGDAAGGGLTDLTAAAETAGGDAQGDSDAGLTCQHPTPPKDPCQENWCANAYGVGMPCTKGGGECDLNVPKDDGISMGAVMCTAVYGNGSDAFCTKPCGDDSDCGKGARCVGDPDNPGSGKGCMLIACSPYPDAIGGGGDAKTTADAADGASDATATADSGGGPDGKLADAAKVD